MTSFKRSAGSILVAGAMALTASCDGNTIPMDQIDGQLHAADCRWQVKCGFMPDVETCLASTNSRITPQAAADLAAGRIHYSPADGQVLVAAIDELSCLRSDRNRALLFQQLALTRAAFTGTVPVGGSCFADDECASGSCNQPGVSGCPTGTCVAVPPETATGSACSQAVDTCGPDSLCSGPDPSGASTCVPLPTAGQTCDVFFADGCAPGLVCASGAAASGDICAVAPATGAACDPAGSVFCDDYRDTCDPATNTCRRALPDGAACSVGGALCRETSSCDLASGTCRRGGGPGDPCTTTAVSPGCLGNLECDPNTLTCVLPPPTPACS
jgi:hypothetical protein